MIKGSSSSLESEFKRLADSQSANLGKVYESFLKLVLAKRPEKKKGLKIEKKPQSKELGVKAERKASKGLGLRVENKAKSKIIEQKANEVGVIPQVLPLSPASAPSVPKLLYEYSNGKSRVMLSPQESEAVLRLIDKSTKEGDVIENGADLKISDSKDRVLFETDSKGVVIYSQNQRNPSVLKNNGLDSAMNSLRSDVSNVISRAEAKKPLGKGVEELNQDAMSLDKETIAKTKPRSVSVEREQDLPKRAEIPPPPARKPIPIVAPPVATKTTMSLSDRQKVSLLNKVALEPGASVNMKGGSLSVEKHEGNLVVFFSDGKGAGEQIASVENGTTKISPQFNDQVASTMEDHISEVEAEKASERKAPEIDDLEAEDENDLEY
jgi:hypothetical protein